MLRRSMACGDSPGYGSPCFHDVIGNRLQPACILYFFGRLIISVALQSLVPQRGKMFQGAYGTCFDRHSPAYHFESSPQSCHLEAIFTCYAIASCRHFRVRLAELAVASGFTPQTSCIQGCRYSSALLYAACDVGIYVVRVAVKCD